MADTPKVVQVTIVWPGGEEYILQHPGNLAWLEAYERFFLGEGAMKVSKFMKWACDEVIHPKKGEKLTVQNIAQNRLMDWVVVLQSFFVAGELHPEFTWRDYEGSGFALGEMEEEEVTRQVSARRKRRVAPVATGDKEDSKS